MTDHRTPLSCQDCPWSGDIDEYALKQTDELTNSTAVCPVCGGQLELTR